jgi:hypothetical protein
MKKLTCGNGSSPRPRTQVRTRRKRTRVRRGVRPFGSELDSILRAGALVPDRPRRLPTSLRRKYIGPLLALHLCLEERDPMVWFSWNVAWDFTGVPHPGAFVPRPSDEPASMRMRERILRIGVPA